MTEPLFACESRGSVGVARLTISEVAHPRELDQMRHQFREYVAATEFGGYVLDLSSLEYLTSAAIGMLLNIHAHLATEGRRFAVVAVAEMVVETLAHPHLDKVFPVSTSVDEAVAAIS